MKKYTCTTTVEVVEERADGSVVIQVVGEPITRYTVDAETFTKSYVPVKETKRGK